MCDSVSLVYDAYWMSLIQSSFVRRGKSPARHLFAVPDTEDTRFERYPGASGLGAKEDVKSETETKQILE